MSTASAFERSAVLGAGVMGHGIAFAYALGGHEVALYDVDPDALAEARGLIDRTADTFVETGHLSRDRVEDARDRLAYTDDFAAAVAGADLVTEAVPEEMALKRETFDRLDRDAPDDAILATNTSGFSITALADRVTEPERVVGTHWFNPPHIVPLVEVIRGEETADATVEILYDELERIGKTPVEVKEDIPGYIGNRIQSAMVYEAFSLLERGIADAEAIDRVVRAGFGFRLPILGIFEKVDHSGLDVHLAVEEYLLPELDRGTEPAGVVKDLVADGKLGLKTGEGIYEWDRPAEEVYAERDRRLLEVLDTYESAGD